MPDGVTKKPDSVRALTLPEVPLVSPRRGNERAVSMISRRNSAESPGKDGILNLKEQRLQQVGTMRPGSRAA
jgi:hypothetical protein